MGRSREKVERLVAPVGEPAGSPVHPALLGVWTLVFSGDDGTRALMTIKDFEDDEPSWFDGLSGYLTSEAREPEVGRAAVRYWKTGTRDPVRYENRFLGPGRVKMGIRLVLDPGPLLSHAGP